jgi:hypothetical protein
VADRHRQKWLSSLALYGETNGETTAEGKPVRTYRWVERVPPRVTICIGHDVVSTSEIVVREAPTGGRVIHLDLGPDRGGRIGHLDIPREALVGPRP